MVVSYNIYGIIYINPSFFYEFRGSDKLNIGKANTNLNGKYVVRENLDMGFKNTQH